MKKQTKRKPTKEEVMIEIPDDPRLKGLKDFPHYLLRKEGHYHCGVCGKSYGKMMSKLLFIGKTYCPNCETELQLKQISCRTNWYNLTTEERAQVAQVHEGKVIFRQYSLIHSVDAITLKENIEIKEIERITIIDGEAHIYHWSNRYFIGWVTGCISENERDHRPQAYHKLFPKSFEEHFKGTELQYTGIGKFIDRDKTKWWYTITRYSVIAAHWPWIENVMKNGMTTLYSDIIETKADMRYVTPKNIMMYRKSLKEKPDKRGASFVKSKRIVERKGLNISDEFIDVLGYEDLDLIGTYFKEMNVEKLVKYINSQNEKFKETNNLSYYRDYMVMMGQVGTPVNDDSTMYPPCLRKAHDDAVIKLNTVKQEKNNGIYAKQYEKLKELNFIKYGLMIIVPKDVVEIIIEGKNMNHCVGSYVDRVARGDTVILFIRHSDNPTEAFYTMEYCNGHIIQVRGKSNAKTTEQVDTFTREWLDWTKQPKKKLKKQIQPVMQLQAINA